jgi:hypothetical protein
MFVFEKGATPQEAAHKRRCAFKMGFCLVKKYEISNWPMLVISNEQTAKNKKNKKKKWRIVDLELFKMPMAINKTVVAKREPLCQTAAYAHTSC